MAILVHCAPTIQRGCSGFTGKSKWFIGSYENIFNSKDYGRDFYTLAGIACYCRAAGAAAPGCYVVRP